MKILVTGGYGFVGSEVVKRLSQRQDCQVIASDIIVKEEPADNVVRIDNQALFENRNGILDGVESVIGCAFSRSSKTDELAKGLEFTNHLFCALKRAKMNNIINISSQGVYLKKDGVDELFEGDEIGPEDAYGVAKYATECMLNDVFSDGENVTNIRLASVNMKQRFTQFFIDAIGRGDPITVLCAEQKTSLIDVADVAEGLISIAMHPEKKWRSLYNLGSGRVDTMKEIVEALKGIARREGGKEVLVTYGDSLPKTFTPMNIDAIKEDFGFVPMIGLEAMLLKMFKQTNTSSH